MRQCLGCSHDRLAPWAARAQVPEKLRRRFTASTAPAPHGPRHRAEGLSTGSHPASSTGAGLGDMSGAGAAAASGLRCRIRSRLWSMNLRALCLRAKRLERNMIRKGRLNVQGPYLQMSSVPILWERAVYFLHLAALAHAVPPACDLS